MTTYNGKGGSYIAGKEVVNKEPPVSKYVVEKLYRVHRERVVNVKPTIDSHVKIPDFLTNQAWKKNAERQKMINIMRTNRSLYDRLARVETAESLLTKENKDHIKRIESKLSYLTKLKEHGRLVNLIKIQKENEYMLRRIEKAKPQYTMKKCKDWYKHHELYKTGRRSDPTGGHIMHGIQKALLPPVLPRSGASISTQESMEASLRTHRNKVLPSISTMSAGGVSSMRSLSDSYMVPSSAPGEMGAHANAAQRRIHHAQMAGFYDKQLVADADYEDARAMAAEVLSDDGSTADRLEVDTFAPAALHVSHPSRAPFMEYTEDGASDDGSHHSANDHEGAASSDDNEAHDDLMLLSSRPFAIPFDSKNCLVQVYSSRSYDENIYLKVVTAGLSSKTVAERALTIDKAYEIINAGGHSSQIVHSTDNEDLQSLSGLLINMFKEADDDGSGSLTFDEFQQLMEQVELGISPQELRFVISEADENENGVVDYDEFVPLAVDLIQSFRARNRAKAINSQNDVMIDDQIMKSISPDEVELTAKVCLEKIFEFDSKKYGLIRIQDLKRCLHAVVLGCQAKLSESEINMLCQMLPRDQFGRIKYNTTPTALLETLSRVRFMTMKNQLIESQGSGLQKYLLDLCREEEARLEHFEGAMDKFVPTGIVPCRSLINILSNSSRLSLSRLQVLVIMSEASVLDGMINYFQFIPVVAKAIELMFEPKALRQRAELIEKTDLSPEALLQCMAASQEVFAQRLSTLFKSYDIDHNGKMDQNEFIACLESLEFHLTYDEMVNLMNNAADLEGNGYLEFNEFVKFFRGNLLNLEREKRIRMLQTTIHNASTRDQAPQDASQAPGRGDTVGLGGHGHGHGSGHDDSSEQSLMDRLVGVFRLSDPDSTGFISHEEFQGIMHNFSVNSSSFLSDVLLSELTVTEDGMVDYMKSLTTCADLLKVFKAKESAVLHHRDREHWAEEKAMVILQASASDINHIVRYIRHKLKKIAERQMDALSRFLEVQEAVRSPQSGLSRNEANMVISRLFYGLMRDGDSSPDPMSAAAAAGLAGMGSPSGPDATGLIWAKPSSAPATEAHSPIPPASTSSYGAVAVNAAGKPLPSNLRSSQQFRENLKSIKYQFTTEELFDAVFEARKVTIMRSLLQENDKTATQQLLQGLLEAELKVRQERGDLSAESQYLPVKACFAILEGCHRLRLNRAQVMFIVSWAECFDRDGLALEISKFAEHASSIIEKLSAPEAMETRANVINQATIDDKKALSGLKEKDLIHYMEQGLAKASDENGEVDLDALKIVLAELPRIKLSDRDVATIVAGLPAMGTGEVEGAGAGMGEGGRFSSQDVIMPCVSLVRSLCRERTIHRRLSLVVTSSMPEAQHSVSAEVRKIQEESLNQLKQLAEKLLNYVKIVMQGDSMLINLPTDALQRRSSQLFEDGYKTEHHSVSVLFKGARFVPMHITRTVVSLPEPVARESRDTAAGGRKHTSRDYSSASGPPKPLVHYEVVKSLRPVFLQVIMVEDKRLYSGSSLVANVTFMDGTTVVVDNVPVKMPSAGMVDAEAAEQFAANLVDTLYLEQTEGSDKVSLNIVGYE